MTQSCIRCGREGDFSFRTLSVRTLRVREPLGEKRVQALGKLEDRALCRSCAAEALARRTSLRGSVLPRLLVFGLLLLLGLGLLAVRMLLLPERKELMPFAALLIIGSVMGLLGTLREGGAERKELLALDGEAALRRAALLTVLECAPKKSGEEDLSYIPLDEETLRMKNGDLMLRYDLLPEIAVAAHKQIHEEAEPWGSG